MSVVLTVLAQLNFRSYEKEILNKKEILKGNLTNAYYHLAAINVHDRSPLASCVTFQSPYRVPPGVEYAVSIVGQGLTKEVLLLMFLKPFPAWT